MSTTFNHNGKSYKFPATWVSPIRDKHIPSYLLDTITLGGTDKPIYVPQVDGVWPPYAEIQASRTLPRQPHYKNEQLMLIKELINFEPTLYQKPPDTEYCTACGEFVARRLFSPDKRKRNSLDSICKTCRASHKRRMYWLERNAAA